jgi:hypothetical protein
MLAMVRAGGLRLRSRTTYNAVDEEGVPAREIAETIGKGLNVPGFRLRRSRQECILVGLRTLPRWICRLESVDTQDTGVDAERASID